VAHVKWFLNRSEADILRDAKPELFTQLSLANILPVACALIALFLSTVAGREFCQWSVNKTLSLFADRMEPTINLFMGVCVGGSLIYCAMTRTLLAPNFIICAHCPWWLPYVECFAGCSLVLGLFARVGAAMLFGLLAFTFLKHSAADCLDLVPLYGLAMYFLLVGRDCWSVDHLIGLDRRPDNNTVQLAHLCVRVAAGVGLMILGLDEKLLHPQLAMELLKHAPALNFASCVHLDNAMFVLCAGLTELLLGLVVVVGSFPRTAMVFLAGFFVTTTLIFGVTELYGHLAYYAIIAAILVRGAGSAAPVPVLKTAWSQVASRLAQPAEQPA
jgi:uncharacterized membrane protein YphA (DoxX/SURF4 family)